MIPNKILDCVVKITVNQIYYDFAIPFNNSNQSVSLGTGFFIDEHHLITAFHVIEDKSVCFASIPKFGKRCTPPSQVLSKKRSDPPKMQ